MFSLLISAACIVPVFAIPNCHMRWSFSENSISICFCIFSLSWQSFKNKVSEYFCLWDEDLRLRHEWWCFGLWRPCIMEGDLKRALVLLMLLAGRDLEARDSEFRIGDWANEAWLPWAEVARLLLAFWSLAFVGTNLSAAPHGDKGPPSSDPIDPFLWVLVKDFTAWIGKVWCVGAVFGLFAPKTIRSCYKNSFLYFIEHSRNAALNLMSSCSWPSYVEIDHKTTLLWRGDQSRWVSYIFINHLCPQDVFLTNSQIYKKPSIKIGAKWNTKWKLGFSLQTLVFDMKDWAIIIVHLLELSLAKGYG